MEKLEEKLKEGKLRELLRNRYVTPKEIVGIADELGLDGIENYVQNNLSKEQKEALTNLFKELMEQKYTFSEQGIGTSYADISKREATNLMVYTLHMISPHVLPEESIEAKK